MGDPVPLSTDVARLRETLLMVFAYFCTNVMRSHQTEITYRGFEGNKDNAVLACITAPF